MELKALASSLHETMASENPLHGVERLKEGLGSRGLVRACGIHYMELKGRAPALGFQTARQRRNPLHGVERRTSLSLDPCLRLQRIHYMELKVKKGRRLLPVARVGSNPLHGVER